MHLFRLNLLLYLSYIFIISHVLGYPLESNGQLKAAPNAKRANPADYPDVTFGLSDAEVESTLNGLSLKDLDALSKLLDDSVNEDEYADASQKSRHRPVKAPQHVQGDYLDSATDYMGSVMDQSKTYEDSCTDDTDPCKDKHKERPNYKPKPDLCTQRPKCSKKPKCSSTTKCTTTTECTTKCPDLPKPKMGGFLDDDDAGPSKCGEKARKKPKKPKPSCEEECDPDDDMCLQRNQSKYKNKPNEDEDSSNKCDTSIGNRVTSLEDMQELADGIAKTNVPKLRSVQWDKENDLTPESFSIDNTVETADVDAKLNELDRVTSHRKFNTADKHARSDPPYEKEKEEASKDVDEKKRSDEMTLKHQQLMRIVNAPASFGQDEQRLNKDQHYGFEQLAAAAPEQQKPESASGGSSMEAERQLEAAQAAESDSFIASNERAPPLYLIRTKDGDGSSVNEPGLKQLHDDQRSNQKLDAANYQRMPSPEEEQRLYSYRRNKRENKETDDAPDNGKESYIKKLMDSFPRDQSNQNNADLVLKEVKLAHVRVKRS